MGRSQKAEQAANSLNLGPQKALELKVIDDIIAEPSGGAHRDHDKAAQMVAEAISEAVKSLSKLDKKKLKEMRFEKFRKMGNDTIVDETGSFDF